MKWFWLLLGANIAPPPRPPRRRGRSPGATLRLARPGVEPLEERELLAASWTRLLHAPMANVGTMLLLSDGTVMAQGTGVLPTWYRLTPDPTLGYAGGTWAQLPSMSTPRLYFGSAVLPSGKVLVLGGEYSDLADTHDHTWTSTGEIYDPTTNTWSPIKPYPSEPGHRGFGDGQIEDLPDGRVLGGGHGPDTYIYDPSTNTWSLKAPKLYGDTNSEESWVKLADGRILSYDLNSPGVNRARRYIPATNTWVDAGAVPVSLSDNGELGPAFLLPDGRAFFFGANGNTAYYTPSTNTWRAGPVLVGGLAADDVPGAMMPNGHILIAVGPHPTDGLSGTPTTILDFDPTTNTYATATPGPGIIGTQRSATLDRMLLLPTGQVLLDTSSQQLALYTPSGGSNPAWSPAISSVGSDGGGRFTLTGTQLNGISEGAAYGDDAQMPTNYPIVALEAAGTVTYARSFNWSDTGVATGPTVVVTQFAQAAPGAFLLSVSASGVSSPGILFLHLGTGADDLTLRVNPADGSQVQVLQGGSPLAEFARNSFAAVMAAGDPGVYSLSVDQSNGNPLPAGGLSFDGSPVTSDTALLVQMGAGITDVALRLDPADNTKLQVLQDGVPLSEAPRSSFDTILLAGAPGVYTAAVDSSNGNPIPAGGLNFDGGKLSSDKNLLVQMGPGAENVTLRGAPNGAANLDVLQSGNLLASPARSTFKAVVVGGGGDSDTLTIDYANGDPTPPGGLTFLGGPGTNALLIDTTHLAGGTGGRALHITSPGDGFWGFTDGTRSVHFLNVRRFNHVGIVATAAQAGATSLPLVTVRDAETGALKYHFFAYGADFRGGAQVAVGDLTGDGIPDVVVAPGPGMAALVEVFNGSPDANGNYPAPLVAAFDAFSPTFLGGANVAVGDVNEDGINDIVVGAGSGWLPQVRVYDGASLLAGPRLIGSPFNAFEDTFRGGVTVAVNDNGYPEVIAGRASAGPPTVNVFNGHGFGLIKSFYAFSPTFLGGVTVATGNYNGDPFPDIIVGAGQGWLPEVVVFSGADVFTKRTPTVLTSYLAAVNIFRGGILVATRPADGGLGDAVAIVATLGTLEGTDLAAPLGSITSPARQAAAAPLRGVRQLASVVLPGRPR